MMLVYNGVITQVEMAQFGGNVIKEISQQLNCCASQNCDDAFFTLPPSHFAGLSLREETGALGYILSVKNVTSVTACPSMTVNNSCLMG